MSSQLAITASDLDAIRADVIDDPFLFAKVVCRHLDLTTTMHRPLMYAAAGCTDKLIDILSDPEQNSYTIGELRSIIKGRHGIDWTTPEGRDELDKLLRFGNYRVFRGAAKSSSFTHSLTAWEATKEPNLSIVIFMGNERKAVDECRRIRDTFLSDTYWALFGNHDGVPKEWRRVPDDRKMMTESRITLLGRTRPDREATIMAFSSEASPVGYHWDRFVVDDLVGKENATPVGLTYARQFLADLTAFRNPGKHYPVSRLHVGTRYADDDDDSVLRKIDSCLSLSIPIEWYQNGKPDDISVRGIPTEPEWADEEQIADLFKEMMDEEGALFWRANYWLDPFAGNARIFPTEAVNRGCWQRVPVKSAEPTKDWIIARPDFNPETKEWRVDEQGTQLYVKVARVRYDHRRAHVQGLNIFFGVDQAFSSDTGADQWSICCLGVDTNGFLYVLDLEYGRGYESMLDTILYLDGIWRPQLIGIEGGGGGQSSTHFWIETSEKFRPLRGRIEKVPTGQAAKREKIINMVAEPLKMKRLYLLPDDEVCKAQMISYKGARGIHESDDIIDSIRIAAETIRKPASKESTKKRVRDMMRSKQRRVDRRTGILL